MNEAEWLTRKQRIDTKLRALNPPWQIVLWRDGQATSKLACHAVAEYPTENGPACYALSVNAVLLGIVEANVNKTKLTVFDCFDGTLIEYFKNTTGFKIQPPTKTPLTIPQIIENFRQNVDRDYHFRVMAAKASRNPCFRNCLKN